MVPPFMCRIPCRRRVPFLRHHLTSACSLACLLAQSRRAIWRRCLLLQASPRRRAPPPAPREGALAMTSLPTPPTSTRLTRGTCLLPGWLAPRRRGWERALLKAVVSMRFWQWGRSVSTAASLLVKQPPPAANRLFQVRLPRVAAPPPNSHLFSPVLPWCLFSMVRACRLHGRALPASRIGG